MGSVCVCASVGAIEVVSEPLHAESRPSSLENWQTNFFSDCVGLVQAVKNDTYELCHRWELFLEEQRHTVRK
jgi:hypothetical protein